MAKTLDSDINLPSYQDEDDLEIWVDICPVSRLLPERGVAALFDGHQVAIFRIEEQGGTHLYAVDHIDPRTSAPTMARGLVGSVGQEPTVAAPLLKEQYSLVTGECLTDSQYKLAVFDVRLHNDQVQLRTIVTPGKQL